MSIEPLDLWLEQRLQLGALGLQRGGQQAVLDGELLWVEVHVLHLHHGGTQGPFNIMLFAMNRPLK